MHWSERMIKLHCNPDTTFIFLQQSVDQLYKVKGYLAWDQRKYINTLLDKIKKEFDNNGKGIRQDKTETTTANTKS